MDISLIAALDEQGGIGKDGGLPWKVRSDLQRFKRLTMGHALIVGRRTWDSIERPLPGRRMIVITRQAAWQAAGAERATGLAEALRMAESAGETEAFIGGGAQIFALALPLAQRFYLTRIHTVAACDTFFPPLDLDAWRMVSQQALPASDGDAYASTFYFLARGLG